MEVTLYLCTSMEVETKDSHDYLEWVVATMVDFIVSRSMIRSKRHTNGRVCWSGSLSTL
jgi:hypothetical protein